MLDISRKINELYENKEFKLFIIEGDHGYGKSAYACNAIAECNSLDGVHSNWDIENFKNCIGYHPKTVLSNFLKMKTRQKVFVWDDAGAWLNALDYQDPFVKDFNKYLQVVRTNWAAIVLTCIDREDVARKIRTLRHTITVDITKMGASSGQDSDHKWRRTASAVVYYRTRKGEIRWIPMWNETFSCKMPDNFFKWYQPLREKYAEMNKDMMLDSLNKRKPSKTDDVEIDYYKNGADKEDDD